MSQYPCFLPHANWLDGGDDFDRSLRFFSNPTIASNRLLGYRIASLPFICYCVPCSLEMIYKLGKSAI